MARLFYHVMQDNAGNLLFDVSGTMRLAGTGTAATIYGDEALTIPIANPMTNHPSYGSFKCYLGPGSYDFYMAKSGYSFETLTGLAGGGSMANQDATAVAITGGTATLSSLRVNGHIGVNSAVSTYGIDMRWLRSENAAVLLQPADADTLGPALLFANLAAGVVGSIATNATTTTYNTTSDSRLKCDVEVLSGALDMLRKLRPITHLWKADGSRGYGFLAHEVQETLPDAGIVTGERDAIDDSGNIVPQMIDPSKLVVWLVGACQELAAQVQALTARLDARGG